MESFSALLVELQRRSGRSQRSVAQRAGVDPAWFSRLLRGEVAPASRAQVLALGTVLEGTVADVDGLLAAAGYLPVSLENVRLDDPALVAVLAVLGATDVTGDDLTSYRQVLTEISKRWLSSRP